VESFCSLLKKKECAIEPTKQEVMLVQRFLIILNAFIIQSVTMDQMMDYRHCTIFYGARSCLGNWVHTGLPQKHVRQKEITFSSALVTLAFQLRYKIPISPNN
jgi:hypothetical protein